MESLAVHPSLPEVVLRRAQAGDLPALVGLLRDDVLGATREGGDLAPYAKAFAAIDADPAHLLLVATRSNEVVATAQLTFLPGLTYRGGTRAQVEAVHVRRDLRGAGVGSWLLRWIVDEAARRGCVMVQLTSNATRTDALRFYQRLGFSRTHAGFKLMLHNPEGPVTQS